MIFRTESWNGGKKIGEYDIFKNFYFSLKNLINLYFHKQTSNFNCNEKTNKWNKHGFNWFALTETLLQQKDSLICLWTNGSWE